MKKNYLLMALIGTLTLSGCQFFGNTSSSSNSSSTSQNEPTPFALMLNKLKQGVQFKGEVNQKVYYLDNYKGTKTGEEATNNYNVSFTYQSKDENGYAGYVSTKLPTGDEYVYINNQAFEGKDGFAYYYDVNYDNELKAFPHYEKNGKDIKNFAHYYINPFHYLYEEDFVKVNDNTYYLVKEKANYFASSILGDIDMAFFEINKTCEFTIENNSIKSIKVVPIDAYGSSIDYETWENVFYLLEQSAILTVEKAGDDVIIEKPTPNVVPNEHKDEIALLQTAFEKFKDNNYTMKVEAEFLDQQGNSTTEDSIYYFTGEEVYLTYNVNGETPSSEKDVYFYNNGKELIPSGYSAEESSNDSYAFTKDVLPKFLALNESYQYNEIAPVISDVNADIFTYNSRYNYYSVNEYMLNYIGSLAFIPKISTFNLMSADCGTKMNVRINNDNEISYIDFNYNYNDGFFYEDGKIRITFENVGTTILPYNVKVVD